MGTKSASKFRNRDLNQIGEVRSLLSTRNIDFLITTSGTYQFHHRTERWTITACPKGQWVRPDPNIPSPPMKMTKGRSLMELAIAIINAYDLNLVRKKNPPTSPKQLAPNKKQTKASRRTQAEEDFPEAWKFADEHELVLAKHSPIHYQLMPRDRHWRHNLWVTTGTINPESGTKPPPIDVGKSWRLMDVVFATIKAMEDWYDEFEEAKEMDRQFHVSVNDTEPPF